MSNPVSRFARHSVSSRERWRAAWLTPALIAVGGACSHGARSVRLPALSPGDEVYRISCEDSIRSCREEAARVCGDRYEVLETTGAPVEPPRVTSAPGPASTGPRYQRPKWIGQMVVGCGAPRAAEASAAPGATAPSRSVDAAAPAVPDRLCIPGVTQECLGPGACRGAQSCLTDGNGYGACDCGDRDGSSVRGEPKANAGAR